MTVQELINELEKQDKDLSVVFVHDEGALILKTIDEVDEVEADETKKYCALFCGVQMDYNLTSN